ncbi:MAG: hypothetical protein Tsb005_20480 [Gammaproteobacteria bacterium]
MLQNSNKPLYEYRFNLYDIIYYLAKCPQGNDSSSPAQSLPVCARMPLRQQLEFFKSLAELDHQAIIDFFRISVIWVDDQLVNLTISEQLRASPDYGKNQPEETANLYEKLNELLTAKLNEAYPNQFSPQQTSWLLFLLNQQIVGADLGVLVLYFTTSGYCITQNQRVVNITKADNKNNCFVLTFTVPFTSALETTTGAQLTSTNPNRVELAEFKTIIEVDLTDPRNPKHRMDSAIKIYDKEFEKLIKPMLKRPLVRRFSDSTTEMLGVGKQRLERFVSVLGNELTLPTLPNITSQLNNNNQNVLTPPVISEQLLKQTLVSYDDQKIDEPLIFIFHGTLINRNNTTALNKVVDASMSPYCWVFDGPGADTDTNKDPLPGTYKLKFILGDNFPLFSYKERLESFQSEISRWLAKIMGIVSGFGVSANLKEALTYMYLLNQAGKLREDQTVVVGGFSRGAYTARILMQLIKEYFPKIKIHAFLIDKVGGPATSNVKVSETIPDNVVKWLEFFQQHEDSLLFAPSNPGTIYSKNPYETRQEFWVLPGPHNATQSIYNSMTQHVYRLAMARIYDLLKQAGVNIDATKLACIWKVPALITQRKQINTHVKVLPFDVTDLEEFGQFILCCAIYNNKKYYAGYGYTPMIRMELIKWQKNNVKKHFISDLHCELFKLFLPKTWDYLIQKSFEFKRDGVDELTIQQQQVKQELVNFYLNYQGKSLEIGSVFTYLENFGINNPLLQDKSAVSISLEQLAANFNLPDNPQGIAYQHQMKILTHKPQAEDELELFILRNIWKLNRFLHTLSQTANNDNDLVQDFIKKLQYINLMKHDPVIYNRGYVVALINQWMNEASNQKKQNKKISIVLETLVNRGELLAIKLLNTVKLFQGRLKQKFTANVDVNAETKINDNNHLNSFFNIQFQNRTSLNYWVYDKKLKPLVDGYFESLKVYLYKQPIFNAQQLNLAVNKKTYNFIQSVETLLNDDDSLTEYQSIMRELITELKQTLNKYSELNRKQQQLLEQLQERINTLESSLKIDHVLSFRLFDVDTLYKSNTEKEIAILQKTKVELFSLFKQDRPGADELLTQQIKTLHALAKENRNTAQSITLLREIQFTINEVITNEEVDTLTTTPITINEVITNEGVDTLTTPPSINRVIL